jgi:hypothetical protein
MKVMGLAVKITDQTVTVNVVVLDDHAATPDKFDIANVVVVDKFDVKSSDDDLATRLGEVAKAISGRTRSIAPDGVVVRRADRPQQSSNTEGPRLRLLAEGAVTAAVHEIMHNTVIRSGKDCGSAYGAAKAELDAAAESILDKKHCEATAAALSGLGGNRTKS